MNLQAQAVSCETSGELQDVVPQGAPSPFCKEGKSDDQCIPFIMMKFPEGSGPLDETVMVVALDCPLWPPAPGFRADALILLRTMARWGL